LTAAARVGLERLQYSRKKVVRLSETEALTKALNTKHLHNKGEHPMEMKTAVVVGYGRSACCRARKGGLAQTHPVDFAAPTLRGILDQIPNLRSEQIEDVILGCAMPVKQMDFNPARLVVQRAGLPESVCGVSINRYCSSGLQAIAYASDAIRAGRSTCIVAGGAESMSMCFAPYPEEYWEPFLKEHSAGAYITVGETAERVAEQYGITRAEMDRAAVESHRRAAKARADGKLAPSIIPVVNASGETIDRDDGIREGCTMESLASLRPCFRPDGLVTAGTSSQTTDAAAFVVLMDAGSMEIRTIVESTISASHSGAAISLTGVAGVNKFFNISVLTGSFKVNTAEIFVFRELVPTRRTYSPASSIHAAFS